jgi:hypothetical protein
MTAEDYEKKAHWEGSCLMAHGKGIGTARKVYQLRHGGLPSDVYVCHTCDHPRCILDAHHWLGSCRDNVIDSVEKGRHSSLSAHPRFNGPHTDESRRKIAEAGKGRSLSVDARERISNAQKGKMVSEETRQKIKDGWVRWRLRNGRSPVGGM